jgi:pyruvate ferredoxin oxidoreductase alpha subunit
MGSVGLPEIYTEAKKQQDMALRNSITVINDVFKEFKERFGREYKTVETYRADDADVVVVMQGSMFEPIQIAVDEMRNEGHKVGAVELRLWRPFPFDDLNSP